MENRVTHNFQILFWKVQHEYIRINPLTDKGFRSKVPLTEILKDMKKKIFFNSLYATGNSIGSNNLGWGGLRDGWGWGTMLQIE
jgi:hypothetical protein